MTQQLQLSINPHFNYLKMSDFSSKKRNKKKHQDNSIEENGTQGIEITKKDINQNKDKKELKADDLRSLAGADNTISIKDLRAAMEALTMAQKPAKTTEEAMAKQFQFWKTQPVPQLGKFTGHYVQLILFTNDFDV